MFTALDDFFGWLADKTGLRPGDLNDLEKQSIAVIFAAAGRRFAPGVSRGVIINPVTTGIGKYIARHPIAALASYFLAQYFNSANRQQVFGEHTRLIETIGFIPVLAETPRFLKWVGGIATPFLRPWVSATLSGAGKALGFINRRFVPEAVLNNPGTRATFRYLARHPAAALAAFFVGERVESTFRPQLFGPYSQEIITAALFPVFAHLPRAIPLALRTVATSSYYGLRGAASSLDFFLRTNSTGKLLGASQQVAGAGSSLSLRVAQRLNLGSANLVSPLFGSLEKASTFAKFGGLVTLNFANWLYYGEFFPKAPRFAKYLWYSSWVIGPVAKIGAPLAFFLKAPAAVANTFYALAGGAVIGYSAPLFIKGSISGAAEAIAHEIGIVYRGGKWTVQAPLKLLQFAFGGQGLSQALKGANLARTIATYDLANIPHLRSNLSALGRTLTRGLSVFNIADLLTGGELFGPAVDYAPFDWQGTQRIRDNQRFTPINQLALHVYAERVRMYVQGGQAQTDPGPAPRPAGEGQGYNYELARRLNALRTFYQYEPLFSSLPDLVLQVFENVGQSLAQDYGPFFRQSAFLSTIGRNFPDPQSTPANLRYGSESWRLGPQGGFGNPYYNSPTEQANWNSGKALPPNYANRRYGSESWRLGPQGGFFNSYYNAPQGGANWSSRKARQSQPRDALGRYTRPTFGFNTGEPGAPTGMAAALDYINRLANRNRVKQVVQSTAGIQPAPPVQGGGNEPPGKGRYDWYYKGRDRDLIKQTYRDMNAVVSRDELAASSKPTTTISTRDLIFPLEASYFPWPIQTTIYWLAYALSLVRDPANPGGYYSLWDVP